MVDCKGYGSNQVHDKTCLLSGGDSEALIASTPVYLSTHDMDQRKRLLGTLYINFIVRTVILRNKEGGCH